VRAHLAVAIAALVLGVLACDRPGAGTRVPAADGQPGQEQADARAFLSAEGAGPTEEDAVAAARTAMLAALLGDAGWAALTRLELERPAPITTVEPSGRIRAQLRLGRVDAAALMSAFEDAEPSIVGPAAWRDVLYAYLRAHVAVHACEQRRRLFAATCDTGDTAEVDDALAQLTTEVELSPPFPDGIPSDTEGRLLRPASVYVLWRGLPIADVPVIATSGPEGRELRATSDARGVAIVVAPEATGDWSALDVRIDAAALLGPRHGAWPERPVKLAARAVDAKRWALVVLEPEAELAAGLQRRMTSRGAPAPAPVAAKAAKEIASAEGDARARRIVALADASSGRIDVVLVASAESRFAGRMGSSKSWSEASGRVQVHDAWTGRVLATIEDTKAASGVGDERASRAAQGELAEALADRLLATPDLRFASR
jgi:hypothetical protein